MKFFELKVFCELKNKIHFQKSPEVISKSIATHLINSGYDKHSENRIKNYVFSNFSPKAEDGYYNKKRVFVFRTFDERIADIMLKFYKYEDKVLKVLKTEIKEINFFKIPAIISLNPVIITLKNDRYWTFNESGNLNLLLTRLQNNLLKKYESVFDEKLNPQDNFISYFQIKNNKPMSVIYKGKKIFGNKFFIVPKEDEISQKLAFVALGAGIGEKNSAIGAGFCKRVKATHFD